MSSEWFPADETKPAPMPLRLIQGFVNTFEFETGIDLFSDRSAAEGWFRSAGLIRPSARVNRTELAEAVRIREALRSLLAGSNEEGSAAELRHHLERAAPVLTVTDVGQIEVSLRPSATVGQALTQLLAVAFRAQVGGQWSRLKICRNPDCQWAFYDAARNRKGTWCSMSECGNRLNNRTYRQRVRSST